MRKEEFFIFIVLQIILPRGQTSVLNATAASSLAPSSVNSTVNTSRKGCEFNGQSYSHAERLPGCFKVYCIQGQWLQKGYIDWNCTFCSAYWGSHLVTFDGWFYDYQGTCEYSLAQEGTSRTPRYAVSAKFIECWGRASCVGPSVFQDSEATLIEMGAFGRQVPDLYKLTVNGALYEIPDYIPRLVREGSKDHPVFAWRYNSCIRLLGSSRIAVEKCGSSLAIWASPDFHGSLYGLCGFYDGKTVNDFTKRDRTVSSLERFPNGEHFPSSWELSCSTNISQSHVISTAEDGVRDKNCTMNGNGDELRNRCRETVGSVQDLLTKDTIAVLLDNCVFDLCSIFKNASGDLDAISSWFSEIETSIAEISDVANKTTGLDDILPEPLVDDELETTSDDAESSTNSVQPVAAVSPRSNGNLADSENPTSVWRVVIRIIQRIDLN
ncbi:mucin-2-like isoform X2 [Macrobrachium nipponense]|uniref:mucin-2-like isoform X2 n=1 Tax=Macrobrachium nipponense TaxID=159736 RepID=UPI0030C7E981